MNVVVVPRYEDQLTRGGDRDEGLTIVWEYNSDLFDEKTVQRLIRCYEHLLEAITDSPEEHVSALPLLSEEEEQRLLVEWSGDRSRAPGQTIDAIFEQQVEASPRAVALVCGDEQVTYGELNERANRLAQRLRRLGVGTETLVSVCLERSPELVVALLGILKAGAAYVPLDPTYPKERLAFMLEDARSPVLITHSLLLERLPEHDARVLLLDADAEEPAQESAELSPGTHSSTNLAYVIYTSGSTGWPKGVAVEHRSVVRLVCGANYVRLGPAETFLLLAPATFDASTFELWGSLLNGAHLAVMPPGLHTLEELGRTIRAHGVTVMWLTAGLFHLMVDEQLDALCGVGQLLAGGDVLSPLHVRKFLSVSAGALIDGYGPTENTTFTCCHRMVQGEEPRGSVPIGRPISNTRVYLLDGRMRPVPPGACGELYAGGAGVARGYLNRAALTAERFVPDPFSKEPGARLYRTGDLARYQSDGKIEFLGRRDTQVKVRGFRIELGEIEAALGSHPSVRDSVVVIHEAADGDKRLVVYFVASEELDAPRLKSFLKERLPDYMMPQAFVALDALPLTPNGKVDRKALPAPAAAPAPAARGEGDGPRTAVEEIVADIWRQVLGVEQVGMNDDFFDLGGHSLLATRVLSRMREALGVEVSVRALFENPTVEGLSRVAETELSGGPSVEAVPLVRANSEEPPLASFAQRRLWFLDRLSPGSPAYNVPLAYCLSGPLDAEALRRSLSELVRRHEVLRTTFDVRGGEPVQLVGDAYELEPNLIDLSGLPERERERRADELAREEAVRGFDLERGPVLRATLVRLSPQEHRLLLTQHHIATDGWSLSLLLEELSTLYAAYRAGGGAALPAPPVTYADYALWQRERLAGGELSRQLAYWRERLAGAPTVLELPADRARPGVPTWQGGGVRWRVGAELAGRLRRLCRAEGVTPFMALLAAYAALLGRYAGVEEVLVGVPAAGRGRVEVERVVGLFANTLVLRVGLSGDPRYGELLGRVREACLGALAHPEVPFEKLVEELAPERGLSAHPLFQVAFAYHSELLDAPEFEGLSTSIRHVEHKSSKFDLTFSFKESDGGLSCFVEYSSDIFEAATVERMIDHFRTLLDAACEEPQRRLSELPLMGPREVRQIVAGWNDTAADYPHDRCVHELFKEQAARTPDAVAVSDGGLLLTYH
jgi:amino acid adenylation domain-containing protein